MSSPKKTAPSVKNMLRGSWLGRVFKADKFLFLFVFLFFALSIFSNLIRLQTSPFFIWGMFSNALPSVAADSFYEITYNDTRTINLKHTWNEPEKTFYLMPLTNYLAVRANHSVDPFETYLKTYWLKKHPGVPGIFDSLYMTRADLDKFPGWYKRWISQQVNEPVYHVCVLEKKIHFQENGNLNETSSDTVLFIP
jgi:hypothetical protein